MDTNELQELKQKIAEASERKAIDVASQLDELADEVKKGTRNIREALSLAFKVGLHI